MERAIAKAKAGLIWLVSTVNVNPTNTIVTGIAHGLTTGDAVYFNSGVTEASGGWDAYRRYYVEVIDTTTIKLKHSTQDASALVLTDNTAGQFIYRVEDAICAIIGDSNAERAGIILSDNAWANKFQYEMQQKNYGSGVSADDRVYYPAEVAIGNIETADADNDTLEIAAHRLTVLDDIVFTGTPPTGISAGTTYYVREVVDEDNFKISATPGGDVLDFSGTQTGAMCSHVSTDFEFTGSWTRIQNAYATVGSNMSEYAVVESQSMAPRGWVKGDTTDDTMKIYTGGKDLHLLFASDGALGTDVIGSVEIQLYNGSDVAQGTAETWNLAGNDKYTWIRPNMEGNTNGWYALVTVKVDTADSIALLCVEKITYNLHRMARVVNFACAASGAKHWVKRLNFIANIPNLKGSVLTLGGNDASSGVETAEEYVFNMREILNTLTQYGTVVMAWYAPFTGVDQAIIDTADEFRPLAKSVAAEYDNVLFFDWQDILGSGAEASAAGLLADEVHANDAGHLLMWQYMKTKIAIEL